MKRAIFIAVLLAGLNAGAAISEQYAGRLADAIHKAENSKRYPYGVITKRRLSESEARRWCLNTIRSNHARWESSGRRGDFLSHLSRVYAPIGAGNDPTNLNQHWRRNVARLMR